jgi:hypothetical protein
MLQALDASTQMTVAADQARRQGRFVCPECGRFVGLRSGPRKAAHFAHFSRTECSLNKPESPRHQALKMMCQSFFAPLSVVWEARLGERRVDALVGGLFVVECQCSPLTIADWRARTQSHNGLGFPVLWLWDVKRLCRKNTLAEAMALETNRRPVWIAPELRLCNDESRQLLFVGDKHAIAPCRLASLTARETAWVSKTSGPWPGAFLGQQALRRLIFFPEFDKDARFHFRSETGLRLVRLGRKEVFLA